MKPEFRIVWKRIATKELRALDQTTRSRVMSAVRELESGPILPGVRKLQGAYHTYRQRVGDYRIVFQVQEATESIVIIRVRHRKDVYRG